MQIIRLENINYVVDGNEIIKDINMNINKGDAISIIGASGSGKSTLLKICSHLISPTKGDLFFYNKNYLDYNPIEIRKNISYIVQTPCLFGNNVYDNFVFVFEVRGHAVKKDRIYELLDEFKMSKSYLEKDIYSLSGGEKQRISIIRSLLYTPSILLLDEATSALDEENTAIVENIIKKLNENGITILWITHDIKQSKGIFNKRINIKNGTLFSVEEF